MAIAPADRSAQLLSVPGVELVENGSYLRTIGMDGFTGSVQVTHLPERQSLCVTIRFPRVQSLPSIISRVRRLFDLGADIETIDAHLSLDARLAPFVHAQQVGAHLQVSCVHRNILRRQPLIDDAAHFVFGD